MSSTGDRGRELGAYAALALCVALVPYGQFLKTLGWSPTTELTLSTLGMGAAVSGVMVLSKLPAERVRPSYLQRGLAVLAPLAVSAVLAYTLGPTLDSTLAGIALHDRELGGITIGLPEGDEVANPQHAAHVRITHVGGLALFAGATWQIGAFEDARAIADTAAASSGAALEPLSDDALVVGNGMPHRSYRIVGEEAATLVTVFACGPRIFGVITGGEGAMGLARRVLASVRCHPADALRGVPAIVELPAGWQRDAPEPGQLSYTNGAETISVTAIDIIPDESLQGAMALAAPRIGQGAQLGARRDVAGPQGTRAVWSGSVMSDGAKVPLQVATWPCPEHAVSLMVAHLAWTSEQTATELLGHIRCARRGEAPPAGAAAR